MTFDRPAAAVVIQSAYHFVVVGRSYTDIVSAAYKCKTCEISSKA